MLDFLQLQIMQNSLSSDLQATANFALQKNLTFGAVQKTFKSLATVDRQLKNSQLFAHIFNCDHDDGEQAPIKGGGAKQRIKGTAPREMHDFDEKKGKCIGKSFGSHPSRVTAMTCEGEPDSIIPSILSESLQITSNIGEQQPQIQRKQSAGIDSQNIQLESSQHNTSNVDIDLNFGDRLYSIEESLKPSRSLLSKLSLNKQVAITYVPLHLTRDGSKRAQLYSKFHRNSQKKQDALSSKSVYSNSPSGQKNELQDCMVNSTANFVKLHEVDLFMKRKEIKIERSDELLQANQKLLAGHLMVKEELQRTKRSMQMLESQFTNRIAQIEQELVLQRQSKKQIWAQNDLKESVIKSIKSLNEQYVKQNNELKEKLKAYIRNMHELKYELSNKRALQISEAHYSENSYPKPPNTSKSIYVPLPTIISLPSNHDLTAHPPSKKVVFPQEAYEATAVGNLEERKGSTKLNNCNSYTHIRGINERKLSSNDIIVQKILTMGCKNSNSQKSIGIKRNNMAQQGSGGSKNFVKINKSKANESSMIIKGGEDQRERSISSYSNISGMSMSHKIGHVPKQPHENKKGIILDYMAENQELEKAGNRKLQSFKFKRQQ